MQFSPRLTRSEYNTVRFVWSRQLQMNHTYNIMPAKERNSTAQVMRNAKQRKLDECETTQVRGCETTQVSGCETTQMADDVPHDEGFPALPPVELAAYFATELEVEPQPLPLSVRPFDPARYHPKTHIIPVAGGIHTFTDFDEDVPDDLLLREPMSHLSAIAVEDGSRSFRGYGATTARDWYDVLPSRVHRIIDRTSFGLFCCSLMRVTASRPLLGALVERWWDTTNSFHFSTAEEMTMTPLEFAMIAGLGVGGDLIPLDPDMGEWVAAWDALLGARPPILRAGMVEYRGFALLGRSGGTPAGPFL
ncbi:hypothetical protein ACSBR2_030015 [Camellia fascicularis]